MSAKHTPGPWFADGEYVHAVEFIRLCCGRGYSSCCGDPEISESRFQIAQCAPENAPLIAAAPELLGVLAEGVELQARHHGDGTGLHIAMIAWAERARAAIARATGEQQ